MDVKDPSASVRHPLAGVAPSDTAVGAPEERTQRVGAGDENYGRPKDIIGPRDITETPGKPPRDFTDFREPDTVDFTDVVDVKDFIDVKDFVDVKDFKDVNDVVDFKDIGDVRDIRDFKDRIDFKDIIEPQQEQR